MVFVIQQFALHVDYTGWKWAVTIIFGILPFFFSLGYILLVMVPAWKSRWHRLRLEAGQGNSDSEELVDRKHIGEDPPPPYCKA